MEIAAIDQSMDFTKLNPMADSYLLALRSDHAPVWIYQGKYELNFLTPAGEPERQVVKRYDPVKISREDKERLTERRFGGSAGLPPGFSLAWPEYYSPIADLIVGDRDWIYIKTHEKNAAGETRYDVFDESGGIRGSFFHAAEIRRIKNGKAYAVSEDAGGFPVVVRYDMEESRNP